MAQATGRIAISATGKGRRLSARSPCTWSIARGHTEMAGERSGGDGVGRQSIVARPRTANERTLHSDTVKTRTQVLHCEDVHPQCCL